MKEWDTLVAAALLGTERQAPSLPRPDGSLGEIAAALDGAAPGKGVLALAAVLSLYGRAGTLAAQEAAPLPEPAPPDEQPACNSAAGARLSSMLQGEHPAVLPEWLNAVAEAGLRAPAEHLPALLDLGKRRQELRTGITAVLGERGRWLAAQNAAWDYSAAPISPDEWQTGGRDARLALLMRMRGDAPERALQMLQETWSEETPQDRANFVAALEVGLSLADEPFLEAALDDRRKEVRKAVADLLSRLPGSALSRRMVERLEGLLSIQKKLLVRTTLEVRLPETCDKAMQRDGVEPKPPQYQPKPIGEKAWWLQQMVATVSPDHWTRVFNMPARELADLARKGEWERPLLEGWAQAAIRHGSVEWAEAILDVRPQPDELFQSLVRALPPERRDAYAFRLLQRGGRIQGSHPALVVLNEHRTPWSLELSRAALDAVRQRTAESNQAYGADWQLRAQLKEWAYFMPPALLRDAEGGWPDQIEQWKFWESGVNDFLTILQFRHDMLQEIAR